MIGRGFMFDFFVNLFDKKTSILIIGCGPVALTLNALFRLNGHAPVVVGRGWRYGILSERKKYNFSSEIIGFDKNQEILLDIRNEDYDEKVDYIFVCTRSVDIVSVVPIIKKSMKKNTLIIPFVTGFGFVDVLKQKLDNKNIINGYADGPFFPESNCKDVKQVGTSAHFFAGGKIESHYEKQITKLKEIVKSFSIPFSFHEEEDIICKAYKKNCYTSIISVLGFYTGKNLGQMLSEESAFSLLKEFLNEQALLAEKLQIAPKEQFYEEILSEIKTFPPELASYSKTEMENGRTPDIYFLSFYLIQLADKFGLDFPMHKEVAKGFEKYKNLFYN